MCVVCEQKSIHKVYCDVCDTYRLANCLSSELGEQKTGNSEMGLYYTHMKHFSYNFGVKQLAKVCSDRKRSLTINKDGMWTHKHQRYQNTSNSQMAQMCMRTACCVCVCVACVRGVMRVWVGGWGRV